MTESELRPPSLYTDKSASIPAKLLQQSLDHW